MIFFRRCVVDIQHGGVVAAHRREGRWYRGVCSFFRGLPLCGLRLGLGAWFCYAQVNCLSVVGAACQTVVEVRYFKVWSRVINDYGRIFDDDGRNDAAGRFGFVTCRRFFWFWVEDVFGPTVERAAVFREVVVGDAERVNSLAFNRPAAIGKDRLVEGVKRELREAPCDVMRFVALAVTRYR